MAESVCAEQDKEVHYLPGGLMYPDTLTDFKTKPKGNGILLLITSKTKSDELTKLSVCALSSGSSHRLCLNEQDLICCFENRDI